MTGARGDGAAMPAGLTIDIDETPGRPGWAVVTLAGGFASAVAARVLGATLSDLLGHGIDTITVEAGPCAALSPEVCLVLVDVARHVHLVGGCLVVAGLRAQDRVVIRNYDVDHRLDLAR